LITSLPISLFIFLSGYILYRAIKKGKEDFRYAAWRAEWGAKANQTAYIRVYMLQLVLSLIIASPLILIFNFSDQKPFGTVLDVVGLSLWIIGFLFEAVGDYQKNKFKSIKENENKFCNIGLWKYTRHPNYFGEALLWWGIFLISINIVPFYYAVWGPLILHFLLVNVSGVAMLEESYKKREGFLEYKSSTNRFIPWFKKGNL
jgi:steroid 5-alpha reductase family enzyme